MTTLVVLFNIETNMYLGKLKPFTVVKDWREAISFENEGLALAKISQCKKVAQDNKLFNWCTRTFYRL